MGKESPPPLNGEQRRACWKQRDRYFECVDKARGDESACVAIRKEFDAACPASWVDHFIRGRAGLKYREMVYAGGGYQPLPAEGDTKPGPEKPFVK